MVCDGNCDVSEQKLFTEVINSRENSIKFLLEHEVISDTLNCENCGRALKLNKHNKFRCDRHLHLHTGPKSKSRCRFQSSGLKGTFFEGTHLSFEKVIHISYHFLQNSIGQQTLAKEWILCSSKTVSEWFFFCREVLINYIQRNNGYSHLVVNHSEHFVDPLFYFIKKYPNMRERFHVFWQEVALLFPPKVAKLEGPCSDDKEY